MHRWSQDEGPLKGLIWAKQNAAPPHHTCFHSPSLWKDSAASDVGVGGQAEI